jgi:hypothetical protein
LIARALSAASLLASTPNTSPACLQNNKILKKNKKKQQNLAHEHPQHICRLSAKKKP